MTTPITLSNIDTDFEQVKAKLTTYLETQDSWKNALTSSTGNTLLNIGAFVGAGALLSIENALQENFPDTARSTKSILNIARTIWANHLKRKVCAQVGVTLTNTNSVSVTIPKYSQFNINGFDCFNRTVINIGANATAAVSLYQGTVATESAISTGIINERFYLGSSTDAFGISDDDLFCIVNETEEYSKTTDGLFETGPTGEKVFFENSLPTGEVEVIFGDGFYGKLPTANSSLTFTYTTTLGKAGNGVIAINDVVTYTDNDTITGVVTAASTAGADALSAEFYRLHGPFLRSAKVRGGGVTRPQYKAIALTYPGIIDCNLLGQAETYPGDKAYENVITAVVLANPLFNSTQFAAFAAYMEERVVNGVHFLQKNPTAINKTIDVSLYCTSKADPNTVRLTVDTALQKLKTLRLGSLGFSFYLSDIEKIIRDAIGDPTLLDYFTLNAPTTDTVVNKDEYVNFTTITVAGFYSSRDTVIAA